MALLFLTRDLRQTAIGEITLCRGRQRAEGGVATLKNFRLLGDRRLFGLRSRGGRAHLAIAFVHPVYHRLRLGSRRHDGGPECADPAVGGSGDVSRGEEDDQAARGITQQGAHRISPIGHHRRTKRRLAR